MADFTSNLQSHKQSFGFLDIDPPMEESINQFGELNQSMIMDNSALNYQSSCFLPLISNDNFFSNQAPEIAGNNWEENLAAGFVVHHSSSNHSSGSVADLAHHHHHHHHHEPINVTAKTEFNESKKRKALDIVSESSSGNSLSPQVSESGIKRRNNSGRGKRTKSKKEEEEKPKEVVHVRARRGQATDSHSLAERVRRGKINERLRCLQDIVPGCYKTMGMAVMLDEIINYVQSLQNQVEFLSMKLTAASTYYDFNSESDAMEKMQREKAKEAKELERLMRSEGYNVAGQACFHSSSSSTWSSLT